MTDFLNTFFDLLNYLVFIPAPVLAFIGGCLSLLVIAAVRRFISG